MEEEKPLNSAEAENSAPAPKKRGRKPKNLTAEKLPETAPAPEVSKPAKRRGRPKKIKPETDIPPAESGAENSGSNTIQGAGSETPAVSGPVWRDLPSSPTPENYEDSEGGVFVHKDESDEFSYTPARDAPQPEGFDGNVPGGETSTGDTGGDEDYDEIPQYFSTSDEDLIQDNYAQIDDASREPPSPDSNNARELPRRDQYASSDERQGRWQRNRGNSNQKYQQGGRFPGRFQQNANRSGQNNSGRFQQNQRGPQNGGRSQNQQRQNSGSQQNRQNQRGPQNQQNTNRRQDLKKKPRWTHSASGESDAMNPADLPEWEVLKSKDAIEKYLAWKFLGKTPPDQQALISGSESSNVSGAGAPSPQCASPNAQISEASDSSGMQPAEKAPDAEKGDPDAPATISQTTDSENTSDNQADIQPKENISKGDSEKSETENVKTGDISYWELIGAASEDSAGAPAETESGRQAFATPSKEESGSDSAICGGPENTKGSSSERTFKIGDAGEIGVAEDFNEIYPMPAKEIQNYFDGKGIEYSKGGGKSDLISRYYSDAAKNCKLVAVRGVLDLFEEKLGGAICLASDNYALKRSSAYVPQCLIEEFSLRRGHIVEVLAMPPREGGAENCPIAVKILDAMGKPPSEVKNIVPFTELTPYYPTRRIIMEAEPNCGWDNLSMRVVDLLTPIGFGQRALIVAPPRTGKTVLMQGIAKSIRRNAPNAKVITLLVDERPEEVTDFRRNVDAEVVASTFDEDAASHVHAAEMVISKARRMVENGDDVVILLDSITRLARAYNALMPNGGRTMSGGVEANALQKPKKFFGSARNIEGGGSLTIIGTALVETGSKMDEVIFEEFKGTGNLELHLDRALSDKRIFPSINMEKSGTRKEELLYHPDELVKIYSLRRAMKGISAADAMEMLIQRLKKVKTNVEFLMGLNR